MRGHSGYFVPRKCWICGKELKTRDECDFLSFNVPIIMAHPYDRLPDDRTGFCKHHNIKEVLGMRGRKYYLKNIKDKRMTKLLINVLLLSIILELVYWTPTIIHSCFK